MSSPQRHGPSKYEKPQILAVPQEISDIIESYLKKRYRSPSIKALRLTCRTFSEGLFTSFVKECLDTFTFYLNEKGAEDVAWLAESRLAPHVRRVEFADRRLLRAVLEYREVGDEKRAHDVDTLAEQIDEVELQTSRDMDDGPQYILPRPCELHNTLKVTVHPVDDCHRSHRHNSDFDVSYPGWDVRWRMINCVNIQELDLSLHTPVSRCLADNISRFPNISHVSTRKRPQGLLQAVDIVGNVVDSASVNRVCHWYELSNPYIQCVCGRTLRHGRKCALLADDMIWPAVDDLSLMIPLLPKTTTLFSTLNTLELRFYTQSATDVTIEAQEESAPLIASFVFRCATLEHLRLYAGDYSALTVPMIEMVILHLSRLGAHLPRLRSLQVDHLDPTSPEIIPFLEVHAEQLKELDLPRILSAPVETYLGRWADFLDILSKATNLSDLRLLILDNADIDWGASRPHDNVLRELLRDWVWNFQPGSELRFQKMATAMRECNGDLRDLDLAVFYRGPVKQYQRLRLERLQLLVDMAREAS